MSFHPFLNATETYHSFFFSHGHRPADYDQNDYKNEFGVVVDAVQQDTKITNKNKLIAPSLQGTWNPEDLFATGFLDSYASSLSVIAMEQYVYISRPYLLVMLNSCLQLPRPKLCGRIP